VKVSLIATVKDASDAVGAFVAAVAAQTRPPDEVVIVDGGSRDDTVELLRAAEGWIVIEEPGANIARGRNIAIAAATHDIIAVTDADCVPATTWLERIVRPLDDGADVAMGFYRPIIHGFRDACLASVNLPLDPTDIEPSRFMPSARSIAYRRAAIERVGGYPEWLAIGEDMWVDHRWRALALDLRFVPDAVVDWPLRRSLVDVWRQYAGYARGDAEAGMNLGRHLLRFTTYGGLAAAIASRRRWAILAAAGSAIVYAREPIRRARRRIPGPAGRAFATVAVPALMGWIDAAKMVGFVEGKIDLRRAGSAAKV
jgi:glycosyltransferase involved in cell wall biosynthesis